MRKWHRWLVVFAGIFMLWIAATGFIGQVISLAGGEHHDRPPPPATAAAAARAMTATPAPGHDGAPGKHDGPPHDLYHLIIDLHSGNYFGPVGKVVSALMGAALLFFSVSGLWMYIDMFRRRKRMGRSGIFWD